MVQMKLTKKIQDPVALKVVNFNYPPEMNSCAIGHVKW